MKTLSLSLLSLVSAASALDLVKETVKLAQGWSVVGVPDANTILSLDIGLAQGNIQGLLDKLGDISVPGSPNYRKWLSQKEVEQYTAPSAQTVAAVKSWLTSKGVSAAAIKQPTLDWLRVELPVSQVEKLLSTKYSLVKHDRLKSAIPRALSYSIPESLADLIDTIQPTTAMFLPTSGHQVDEVGKRDTSEGDLQKRDGKCDPSGVTVDCIKNFYQAGRSGTDKPGSHVGVFGNGGANHTDAHIFYSFLAGNVPRQDFSDITYTGKGNDGTSGLESAVDVDWAGGVANGNSIYYISTDTSGDLFTNFAQYVQTSGSGAPPAISISWIYQESQLSFAYANRICNSFAIAGAKGISLLAASGDSGAQGLNGDCSKRFEPLFPPSCPYVTTVGGTQFDGDQSAFTAGFARARNETVARFGTDGGSGGGFSNYFSQPSWQKSDVQGYLNYLGGYAKGKYNVTGRGYPDVSAQSQNMFTCLNGQFIKAYGTSISAPIWAGFISQLNDLEVNRGKPTLGFLNPFLYNSTIRSSFVDVTTGKTGCAGSSYTGFPAYTGWDAATGLGTPQVVYLNSYLYQIVPS